jgi:hypothetical protein
MARSQTARSTIKNDPFATLIPDRSAEPEGSDPEPSPEPQPPSPTNVVTPLRRDQADAKPANGQKREKLTVHLTHDLIERVKNAAYWNPRLTIASIAELGVKYAIEQVEKENGGPYPQRESELKGGRPIGS